MTKPRITYTWKLLTSNGEELCRYESTGGRTRLEKYRKQIIEAAVKHYPGARLTALRKLTRDSD